MVYVQSSPATTGIASSISVVIKTDSTDSTLSAAADSGITEIGSTGVYAIPLTAAQTNGSDVVVIPSTTTTGVTFGIVVLRPVEFANVSSAADAVWTRTTRTTTDPAPDLSTLATAASIVNLSDAVNGLPTASQNATAVWTRTTRTTTDPAPDLSTLATAAAVANIATEVIQGVLGTNLTTLSNAAVGSLKTIFLLQTNAKVVGDKLKVYEPDGTTVHAQYDLITTTDPILPIIGLES